jgi:integrase
MLGGSKTEAGKNRVIPISHKITSYIAHFVANADKLLIDGFPGNKILSNFRRREWVDTLNLLGINNPPKTPHAARHTFASLMVRAEVAPEQLQKIIGHANYQTTADIYIHADTPQLIEAIDKL